MQRCGVQQAPATHTPRVARQGAARLRVSPECTSQPCLSSIRSSAAPRSQELATTSSNTQQRESDSTAVIIVDHGSRRTESNEQLEQFVRMYRAAHPGQFVLAAHMELAQPDIRSAVAECLQAGCSRVVVAPYFLSQGRHIQQDIPALVAEAQAAHSGVDCTIAEPIGLDAAVVDIINSRVQAALEARH